MGFVLLCILVFLMWLSFCFFHLGPCLGLTQQCPQTYLTRTLFVTWWFWMLAWYMLPIVSPFQVGIVCVKRSCLPSSDTSTDGQILEQRFRGVGFDTYLYLTQQSFCHHNNSIWSFTSSLASPVVSNVRIRSSKHESMSSAWTWLYLSMFVWLQRSSFYLGDTVHVQMF